VPLENVVDRPAVGGDVALEAPFVAQDLLQQRGAGAARLAVDAVVRAHHRRCLAFFHARLERGQVSLPQIPLAHDRVKVMPVALGSAVRRKVLRRGNRLEDLRIIALQSLDERHPHGRGQVGILAVGLLPATPARIAEDIDVGRPHGEARVELAHPAAQELVMLRARLVRDGFCHLCHQADIPRGCEADGLREDRGDARARDAVQALVPPTVSRDAEPLDRGRIVDHLRNLLLQRHPGD